MLATPSCPVKRHEVFIQGTAPTEFCEKHGGVMLTQVPPVSWLSKLFGGEDPKAAPEAAAENAAEATAQPQPAANGSATNAAQPRARKPVPARTTTAAKPAEQQEPEKKPGLLNRIFGIFGGGKKSP
jgi:hypothetical protein